ncbi:MerR family transcriptional regulator [Hoyosella altamirensis]|uniref:DNA-binding transcriptional MerR regulator n=1 Tax=Hoyosella altamirensis TaxID=616997 RepID=A0A839RJK9_9ACTN|nr:MerR family transcriptional regulator [Hoyosella altamirensis]MBB3036418.1 DNA-binding transcriptional MerR regulator [Hoyosella altamirensis]
MSELLGIADVSERTGLSKDTLRWYENEGLIPHVSRGTHGRRRYDEPTIRMIELLVRLRRTGMPVKQMKAFVEMVSAGAETHGRRMQLLTDHREEVLSRIRELLLDVDAIEEKIDHYSRLIAEGRDCGETPIRDANVRSEQRRTE